MRAALSAHLDRLFEREQAYLHLRSFVVMRQLGANFAWLSTHLRWRFTQCVEIPPRIAAAAT